MTTDNQEIVDYPKGLALIDHHVHSSLNMDLDRADFELFMTESSEPIPSWMTQFDSQVGFAVRKYCAPALGLPEHASSDEYWEVRSKIPPAEVSGLLLSTAGISDSLIDTGAIDSGQSSPVLFGLEEYETLSGQRAHEIVRLESMLEKLANDGICATDLEAAFDKELAAATRSAVGFKSIIAYRYGFDFEPTPPNSEEVRDAAEEWLASRKSGPFRLSDPVLLRMLLCKGVSTGLPVQLHAGYGDIDLDLARSNPLLLTRWLKLLPPDSSDVILLHCYPFHREAGYLAQVFSHVFFDTGLAINYSGAMSDRVVAESLELAPFSKILFSTDAWGLPELHHIGAKLWRRAMQKILSELVSNRDWPLEEAKRIAKMIGRDNAIRIYKLQTGA